MSHSKQEIYEKVQSIMVELFELDPAKVTLEAKLGEDLGLDSIDAIDLITYLQEFVGRRLQPEDFKAVRTVGDVIDAAEATINQVPSPQP
ncbi:MAG TPA: acyl carrier protein [Bdellovibrionota bacterium]|jgi:acyl carrier protein|nr:acyl carrier protein [Bdellovibrionota bacterium]